MKTSQSRKEPMTFTGKHMLISLLCFFGVIITVNFTMAFLASGSWTGLVVKNSYVASQHFNEELKHAKLQRKAGLSSEVHYKAGSLFFKMRDQDANSVSIQNLTAEYGRPAYEQADQKQELLQKSGDVFEIALKLEPGVWAIKLTGDTAQMPYRRDVRLFVDADGNGRVE